MTRRRPLLLFVVLSLAAAGCGPRFTLPVEAEEGGILLSSWTDGEDLIAVGGQLDDSDGLIVRRQDGQWCAEHSATDRPLWWVHGSEPGRWFAVGAQGLILHHQDGETTDESVETEATLFGVWDEGERVWAVGGEVWGARLGEIWLRENGTWTLFAEELPGVLFKVWERWIVGEGVAYHLAEDDSLEERHPPQGEKLLTVRGRSDTDVWAVGGTSASVLLHHDGSEWSSVEVDPLCTSQPLNGIWTGPDDDVWIAGMSGAMGRWDGEAWDCADLLSGDPLRDLTNAHFHAVGPGGDGGMLWFGGNLFARGGNVFTLGRHDDAGGAWSVGECSP